MSKECKHEQHGRRVYAISGKSHATLPLRSKSAAAKPRRSSGGDPIGRCDAAAAPMTTSITIAGPKFSGKPGDWPEAKTEIVDAFNNAGVHFVTAMGEQLFKYAGSGDHG